MASIASNQTRVNISQGVRPVRPSRFCSPRTTCVPASHGFPSSRCPLMGARLAPPLPEVEPTPPSQARRCGPGPPSERSQGTSSLDRVIQDSMTCYEHGPRSGRSDAIIDT